LVVVGARRPVLVTHAFEVGAVAGVDNDIIELGVGVERIANKILSPLGASLNTFQDSATFLSKITMVTYRLVVPTAEEVPQGLGNLDGQRDRRNDSACRNALLERFSERSDWGVDCVNGGIELLQVGCGGHRVIRFVGESFVDIGVDKGLAFLEGSSELADGEFVLAGADVFFRRHGCLVNWMSEEMLNTGKKDGVLL
jgi:hypothetical protein